MKQRFRNGTTIQEDNRQDRLLKVLYGSTLGRILLKPLVTPVVSKLAGAFLSTRCSCVLIQPFIRSNNIDMMQFEEVKYHSYNEFFSRKIRKDARPIDMEPTHFISPADSKLTVLPISSDLHFTLKHTEYSVASLLKNKELARDYHGGYAFIFRLTVDDYHRYCYVDDGIKEKNIPIPGKFHTVNPIANDYFPIYKENTREYSILHSQHFGDIVMMEVGALLVGKIVNLHENVEVKRGQEKGYFQFGGSTVMLLTKANMVTVDDDILENSKEGIETIVKFGEKIARK